MTTPLLRLVAVLCALIGGIPVSANDRPEERAWQVFEQAPTEALAHHLRTRAEALVAHRPWPEEAADVPAWQAETRRKLREAMAFPGPTGTPPESETTGAIELDACTVLRLALRTGPGLYAPCNLYLPRGVRGPAPAVLIPFGHGDRLASYQVRAREFAQAGFVVLTVEPYGGGETGSAPPWNDYHGGMPAAALMAAGRPLNGLVAYNHVRALDYLCSRPEVDAHRVGVTGVSGGGTHSLWLAAVDPRIVAAVPISCAWVSAPDWYHRHHCLCDTAPGLLTFADEQALVASIAPRAFRRVHLAPEVTAYTPADLWGRQARATRIYDLLSAGEWLDMAILDSPHAFSPVAAECSLEWLVRRLGPMEPAVIDPSLPQEVSDAGALMVWPKERPDDLLDPTQYAQHSIAALSASWPKPPEHAGETKPALSRVRAALRQTLGAPSPLTDAVTVERVNEQVGITYAVLRLHGDLPVPFIVQRPSRTTEAPPPVCLVLHSLGKQGAAEWDLTDELLGAGWAVAAVDLPDQGEVRGDFESSGYLGSRDQETCLAAMLLGESLPRWWADAVKQIARWLRGEVRPGPVACVAQGETGLSAIVAAVEDEGISPIVLVEPLASYRSTEGFGHPYVYGAQNEDLGGIGSTVWYQPGIAAAGDVGHFVALATPRPVRVVRPLIASGRPMTDGEVEGAFGFTRAVYEAGHTGGFRATTNLDPRRIVRFLDCSSQ